MTREYAAEIDWTISLTARNDKGESAFITEFDVRLDLAYWQDEHGAPPRALGLNIVGHGRTCFRLEGFFCDAGYITEKSDPAWFGLVRAGLFCDAAKIADKLNEIEDGISAPRMDEVA